VLTSFGTVRALAPEFEQFREQLQAFRFLSRPLKIALFRDEDDKSATLPVLIAPNLTNIEDSEDELIDVLKRSGIAIHLAREDVARTTFVDRVSEFLEAQTQAQGSTVRGAQQAGKGRTPTAATIVNSNRSGDTVLYCKGYFISTASAFGVSTPASSKLSAGRYSFGIVDSTGGQVFEGVLWTCPTTVRLNMP
jgi:hypothetical protein